MVEKQRIRAHMAAQRAGQPPALARERSEAAQKALLAHAAWQGARQVALYMPIRGEVETALLLDEAWAAGREVLLPRCRPRGPEKTSGPGRASSPERAYGVEQTSGPEQAQGANAAHGAGLMDFVPCTGREDLRPGVFGIMEPAAHLPALAWDSPLLCPGVLVLPGVAFDRSGRRLGYGGGYYDRALSHAALDAALRVGLAFSWQVLDALPAQAWDRSVNCLCTEEGCQCL